MKIHEKILLHFQSCNSPVDKEGYLAKKGERNTSYQKRWFILKGNLLFYKDRPADRDLIGVIVLEGCTIQLCESEEQFAFSLVWSEPGASLRTYKLSAEDQAGQESWIKALLTANHNYLALLLVDMEKQYREAVKFSTGGLSGSPVVPSGSTQQVPYSMTRLSPGMSTLLQNPGPGVGQAPSVGSLQMLHAPPISSKTANKRSPKLWPKRNANVVPVNGPALPQGDWSVFGSETMEDFGKLHEEFGKEVKQLIAERLKKGQKGAGAVEEEDLIDFG